MKKINKNDLRLDKEVISFLSQNELSKVAGGENTTVIPADTLVQTFCRPCQLSQDGDTCEWNKTKIINVCNPQVSNPCHTILIDCNLSDGCDFESARCSKLAYNC